jgi:dGTPase
MDWTALLSDQRLRKPHTRASKTRSAFQQDADLVVFSAAFRRLQDKTQVQPLTEDGRVRTRLTHSIEVASVGRSLGSAVAYVLAGRRGLDHEQVQSVASSVFAACLAHDIGNPPFGHGGEDAIQAFFAEHGGLLAGLSPAEAADLRRFDGNAQGFRIVTQLENYRFDGGLRLTYATLGAFTKYVVAAADVVPGQVATKKPGFFSAEAHYMRELGAGLGLPPGVRHPLVYLMEAADDICYAIVDVEDGFDAGLVDFRDAVDVLASLADMPSAGAAPRLEQLHRLRGVAIGRLVESVAEVFLDLEPSLLAGEACRELCALTPFHAGLAEAKALARQRIFAAPSVVERLLGGQRVIGELLSVFAPATQALADAAFEPSALRGKDASIVRLLGESYQPTDRYTALLGVTDFVSSLTDGPGAAPRGRLSRRFPRENPLRTAPPMPAKIGRIGPCSACRRAPPRVCIRSVPCSEPRPCSKSCRWPLRTRSSGSRMRSSATPTRTRSTSASVCSRTKRARPPRSSA